VESFVDPLAFAEHPFAFDSDAFHHCLFASGSVDRIGSDFHMTVAASYIAVDLDRCNSCLKK
jgi:hypothetical protein